MKNSITVSALIRFILLLVVFLNFNKTSAFADPTYTLTVKNFNRNAPDSLTFDVYMLHTNSGSSNFEYALGQYFFKFNQNISNGGTLTYKIIDSQLPVPARPRNPTVTGDELRLASNSVLGAGNGPPISSSDSGTLIVRMSLKTSVPAFASNQSLNLQWKNSNQPAPFTKIFAYVGTTSTEITTPSTHSIQDPLSIHQISHAIPESFELMQNYPNPFNPSTKINFSIPKSGFVSLKIFDIAGREISNLVSEKLNAGFYEYEFNASNLTSGVYFYVLKAQDFKATKRMVLVK